MSEDFPPKTTVAVVDDHPMVSEMLARTISLEDDLVLSGSASSVAGALALVERERPEVVLMDFRLPDGSGIDAVNRILAAYPDTKIVMLSGSGNDDLLARAIEVGCVGLVNKNRPVSDVLAAVRSAARGELVIRPEEFTSLLSAVKQSPHRDAQSLTARELDVLRLLARGCSTERISDELFISINTVRNHVANILNKLNVHSKLEAVAVAARDGLIDILREE